MSEQEREQIKDLILAAFSAVAEDSRRLHNTREFTQEQWLEAHEKAEAAQGALWAALYGLPVC